MTLTTHPPTETKARVVLAPPKPAQAANGINILVVDDSEDSRELTEAALRSAGYKDVRGAASAREAFKFLEIERSKTNGKTTAGPVPIDIVLLDIVMPDIDGIEACARIRSDGRYGDVPIIMVTSLADMDSLSHAFLSGATDYIAKPVNRTELLARVRAALKLKAELERRQERERELLTFLSSWGDRRATLWIDDTTGLFVGEVAEAYLTSTTAQNDDELVSVITLAIDRLDVVRSAQGEHASRAIQSKVARAIRAVTATVGVVAASYRNGLMVVIAPDYGGPAAEKLAQSLQAAVAQLGLTNRETIAVDRMTASIAVVTGRVSRGVNRVRLLTQAIATVQRTSADGGNQVLIMHV